MTRTKILAVILTVALGVLAMAPETFACNRYRGYRTRGVAGATYYNPYYGRGYSPNYGYSGARRHSSVGRAVLTIAAPAAIGAGIGALAGGGKGAGVGALLGGGGGALYYLIKHRRHGYGYSPY